MGQSSSTKNSTMFQAFEWYLPYDHQHWNRLAGLAKELSDYDFDKIWLPPAYKDVPSNNPVDRAGYGVYDRYDLGEFEQQGAVATKYGTKDEYLNCIQALQEEGMQVLCDIVLSHMIEGDQQEDVVTDRVEYLEHNKVVERDLQKVFPTKFTFPGRRTEEGGKLKYSQDEYDQRDFNGYVEDLYDEQGEIREDYKNVYRFQGKSWNPYVNKERDNFDCLMGCNVDMDRPDTQRKMIDWLNWYLDFTQADGIRIDAVKHISYKFMPNLVSVLRREMADEELFAVAEYWDGDMTKLVSYLGQANNRTTLFDVALHYNLVNAATDDNFDLRVLKHRTLLESRPKNAITFVDNHDTEPGQALESYVPMEWKQRAYAMILFQQGGIPCVFYGDLYGINFDFYKSGPMSKAKAEKMKVIQNLDPVPGLGKMCCVRYACAYGQQTDYFDDPHLVGYTRAGIAAKKCSGMAVLISKKPGAKDGEKDTKRMYVNRKYAGEVFVNVLNPAETVSLDEDGTGEFFAVVNTTSIWIRKSAHEYLMRRKPGYKKQS